MKLNFAMKPICQGPWGRNTLENVIFDGIFHHVARGAISEKLCRSFVEKEMSYKTSTLRSLGAQTIGECYF